MKAKLILLAILTTLLCPFANAEPLRVAASFSILGDIVRNIGGERILITTLVGPDQDAHVYQPTPADVQKLAATRLFFVNGMGFEGWLKRLQQASEYQGEIVTVTQGIQPIATQSNPHDLGYAHQHHIDPHAWQDPQQVKQMVTNIRDALSKADPQGRAYYLNQTKIYINKLDQLQDWAQSRIATIPETKRAVLTSHDAFAYLGKRFGIQLLSPQGVSTEAEASAKDVAELIRQMKKTGIRALFLENISNPKLAEQIARETGAIVGLKLYSDALSHDPAADSYITMYRSNIENLVKGMQSNR